MLCLLEDRFSHSEASRDYVPAALSKCELFFPTSDFPPSCSLTSAFPGEDLDDGDLDFSRKRSDETGKESELSSQTFEQTNRAQCRNNVSPAIQKIMRMMRLMPCLSTPLANRTTLTTKRALSAGHLDAKLADDDDDDDSLCILKRRLDASFSPDVPAFRRHSMDGRALETRESESSMSTCRSCDFMDALANDEAVASVSRSEIERSPARVQIVATMDQASPAEDRNYVSESYFLLMTSSRNQRMRNEAFRGRP